MSYPIGEQRPVWDIVIMKCLSMSSLWTWRLWAMITHWHRWPGLYKPQLKFNLEAYLKETCRQERIAYQPQWPYCSHLYLCYQRPCLPTVLQGIRAISTCTASLTFTMQCSVAERPVTRQNVVIYWGERLLSPVQGIFEVSLTNANRRTIQI